MTHTVERQLASPLPGPRGTKGLLLSASKEIEQGARAMLLLVEGRFRLDVAFLGDTLRTLVRNLSGDQLTLDEGLHPEVETHFAVGDVSVYQPAQSQLGFSLGSGPDRVTVAVMIGVLRFVERGTVRITAQAALRQSAGTPERPPTI